MHSTLLLKAIRTKLVRESGLQLNYEHTEHDVHPTTLESHQTDARVFTILWKLRVCERVR